MNTVALNWSLAEVTEAVSGDLIGAPGVIDHDTAIQSVSTNSRAVPPNSLFVALVGEKFDGHGFADQALASGAAAVLVDRGSSSAVTPRIEVDSTLDALADLAEKRRGELRCPVVAITGTSGKTTTKDLLAGGIAGAWSSPASFNNDIGVPLTVLATPSDATALILEVGSRGVGHIKRLGGVIRPDIAVITNLGVGHMETFGTREQLRDAKYELVEALGEAGIAVIPADEPSLRARGGRRNITFSYQGMNTPDDDSSDVRISDVNIGEVSVDGGGLPSFTCETAEGSFDVSLSVAGLHQAGNAAAAIGVALAMGLPLQPFISGIESATGATWRMEIHRGKFTVVNDSYNANPQSVASALETVARMDGRHVAVLGHMAELGPFCQQDHERMGRLALDLGFAELVVVGVDHGYELGFGKATVKATDIEVAADTLTGIVEPGDVVLVKASRSASLERLALQLIKGSES